MTGRTRSVLAAGLLLAALVACAPSPQLPVEAVVVATPAAGPAVAQAAGASGSAQPRSGSGVSGMSLRPSRPSPAPPAPPPPPPSPPSPPSPAPSPSALHYDLVLLAAALIDGTGAPPVAHAAVAIKDGRVAWAGPAAELSATPDTPRRELPGATIMPGVINAHAHIHKVPVEELQEWTRAGVTTIRDLAGPRDAILQRGAELAAADDPTLPRLLVAGPMVTVPGGYPISIDGPSDRALAVTGAEDAAAQVSGLLDAGADVIKISVSGRTDVRWPELSNEEIAAITDVAHRRGVRVSAHVDRAVALRRAVEAGIDDAAHMPRDSVPGEVLALMAERGVALVPTIHVYEQLAEERGNGDEWRRTTQPVMYDNLRRFVAAGGVLALGDDYGNPGVSRGMPMPELRHWLAAGLSPMQVLMAATSGAAEACGLGDQVGLILPGYTADVLAVDGDPLSDIAALERPLLVLRSGRVAWEP